MAKEDQGTRTSETEVSVDLNAADPGKAVSRRSSSDIARSARGDNDEGDGKPRTKAEKELFKRMGRLERNLTRQFNQREADREAAHQREISELKSQLSKVELDRGAGNDAAADAAHDAAIAALKGKLEAAMEKGDSTAAADITLQISKLDAQYWAKKAAQAGQTTRETSKTAEGAGEGTGKQAPARATGPTRAGSRFIAANDWWDDEDYAAEQGAANAIYLQLVKDDGFDPKSDETFKEVAKRLKAKFPKLDVKPGRGSLDGDDDPDPDADPDRGDDADRDQDERRDRARAAAVNLQDRGDKGRLERQNRQDPNRRVLTAQEIATMRACRLDPDNDRDVVQFMREAAALEAAQS